VGVHGKVGDHFLVSTEKIVSTSANTKGSGRGKRTRIHRAQCIE
jgi:hypothetical protein